MSESTTRKATTVGALHYSRKELDALRANNEKLAISVVGILTFDDDISAELARDTIESVKVRGVLRAGSAIKEALADRTR
jgi:uncharacterized protein YunC (DUF1805 family)